MFSVLELSVEYTTSILSFAMDNFPQKQTVWCRNESTAMAQCALVEWLGIYMFTHLVQV